MTASSTSLLEVFQNVFTPEKTALEELWAQRLGVDSPWLVFSHLDEKGNGVFPSGVVLEADGTTARSGAFRSVGVDGLAHLGEILEGHPTRIRRQQEGAGRVRATSTPPAPWTFVEESALIFWSMSEQAYMVGNSDPMDLRILPEPLAALGPLMVQDGTLTDGNLSFTVQGVEGVRFVHRFGLAFYAELPEGFVVQFHNEEKYRETMRFASQLGTLTVEQLEMLCPPPHDRLNKKLADALNLAPELLAGIQWSGFDDYSILFGEDLVISASHDLSSMWILRDGKRDREVSGSTGMHMALLGL